MAIAATMQGAITGIFDYNNAIRAPYLSNEELAQLAAGLTVRDCVSLPAFEPFIFKKRLKNNEEAILQAFKSTVAAYEDDKMIAPAAEWLLDNHYLVEENIRQVRRALPAPFYRELPVMKNIEGTALPRIFVLAWLYIAHTHSSVAVFSLSKFR